MLKRRTDLAEEARILWREESTAQTDLTGVETEEHTREGFRVTTVRISTPAAARALGKPIGSYITLQLDGLRRREEDAFGRAARALAAELSELLNLPPAATALVVGLGNRDITPDAVGPKTAGYTMVTRHLIAQMPEQFGSFRSVAALSAGVLATTGVESCEMVHALVKKIQPDCVIAVDALASRSLERLCRTIQLADTGIIPGSGVGNSRGGLTREKLGVPVIALGVPTVVDAATLCMDILSEAGSRQADPSTLCGKGADLFVTPRDIDQQVADISKVIGFGINLALHSGLTVADVEMFLS